MRVLGIAGTAKNTGKTTTTVALINHWRRPDRLAVTSIGYDGEAKDNVTGLPKPRLTMPVGALVVTARQCIGAGTAVVETIAQTHIPTPLGQLIIGRVRERGLVVLAGPNNRRALEEIIHRLARAGADLVLVDGALGRLAPLAASDGLVLATGAARTRNLEELASETAAMASLMSLPVLDREREPDLEFASLLVPEQGRAAAKRARGKVVLEFSGVVDDQPLSALLAGLGDQRPDLVFADPVKLLLSARPVETNTLLRRYCDQGGRVGVRRPLPLLAVTVNPYYPQYNKANGSYAPGWVDASRLYQLMKGALTVPVVDVVRQGGSTLANVLGLAN